MLKKLLCCVVIFIAVSAFSLTALSAGVPEAVLEAVNSVLYVDVTAGKDFYSGSCFVAANCDGKTYTATNYHVIKDADEIYVWLNEKERSAASAVAYDPDHDLAILLLDEKTDLAPLEINEDAQRGDGVYTIGFPGAADYFSGETSHTGDKATITDGIISAARDMVITQGGPSVDIYQITAPINPGNSGGPLVNEAGGVIGINTFSADDSQGIYASVCVSHLVNIMESKGIAPVFSGQKSSPAPASAFPLWIIIAGAVIVIAAVAAIIIGAKKRKLSGAETLADFIKRTPFLSAEQTVSLLMPAALTLRDAHVNGKLFLTIEPQNILLDSSGSRIAFHNGGAADPAFIAPERLGGAACGVYSDIYSLCASVKFAVSTLCSDTDPRYAELMNILGRGTERDPQTRFSSVQELIFALSSFNTTDYRSVYSSAVKRTRPAHAPHEKTKKPRAKLGPAAKRRITFVSAAIPAGVLFAFAVYFSVNILICNAAIAKNEYTKAAFALDKIIFSDILCPKLTEYTNAGKLLEEQKYDEAIIKFEQLGNYRNSKELYCEWQAVKIKSFAAEGDMDSSTDVLNNLEQNLNPEQFSQFVNDMVNQLIESGKHQGAEALFGFLAQKFAGKYDVQKIENLSKENNYLWSEALYKNGEKIKAFEKMKSAVDYKDADKRVENMLEDVYFFSESLYDNGQYKDAYSGFKLLGKCNKTSDYLIMCKIHLNIDINNNEYDRLLKLIDFKDVKELLVINAENLYDNGEYDKAYHRFEQIQEYDRVSDYLVMCKVHLDMNINDDEYLKLRSLIGFKDVNALLLKNTELALNFLHGEWIDSKHMKTEPQGDDRISLELTNYAQFAAKKLYVNKNGNITTQHLMGPYQSGTYIIKNGLLYDVSNDGMYRFMSFKIKNANEMYLYFYQTNETFLMMRK